MKVNIEAGTEKDLDELEALYNSLNDYLACHINYPGWKKGIYPVRETAKKAVEEKSLYVARISDRLAGSVILRNEPEPGYSKADWKVDFPDSEVCVIYTLAVHPDFWKHGLGKGLMEFAEEFSIQKHAKAIRLDVYEENVPAIRLYKTCGYQYIDTVDLGYGEYGLYRFELYQKLL